MIDPLDKVIVGYGPERVVDVVVHDNGVIESFITKPARVFSKRPDGALVELYGNAKTAALETFWDSADAWNAEQEDDE